jgi:hypothetical protein
MIINRRYLSKAISHHWLAFGLSLALLASCSIGAPEQTLKKELSPEETTISVRHMEGEPLSEALVLLHPTNRDKLLDFISTVPDPLPNELSHPQAAFFQPGLPISNNTLIVDRRDDYVEIELAIANPGSNDRQTNVICLRNNEQTNCTPEADVWSISLPADSLAFVPLHIQAAPGDMLTFLFMPNREPERWQPASRMLWVFVEQEPASPPEYMEMSAHAKLYDGCDFAHIQTNLEASQTIRIPGTQKRGTLLYLIIQTCEPANEALVQLIPIVDRNHVVNLPGEVWHIPIRLAHPATAIPIDTQLLGDVEEFQIAIVPVGQSAQQVPDWWGWFPFTHAVSFTN